MDIILASTSKYRVQLLRRLGIEFMSIAPSVDEESFHDGGITPLELAETLALEKARVVAKDNLDSLVIGGDQLVSFDGEILGKPHNFENAFDQIKKMQDREHVLITSIALVKGDKEIVYTDRTFLRMRPLCDDEIKRYLEYDTPYDCAGSYKLESLGISLFAKIKGIDHTAIQGIPLMKLSEMLREFGISVP